MNAQANENKWGRQNRKEKPFRLIWNRMGVRNKLEQIWSKMRKTCSFGYHFRADRCACEFSHSWVRCPLSQLTKQNWEMRVQLRSTHLSGMGRPDWGLTPKHFKDKEIATRNNAADAATTKCFKTEVRSRHRCKTSIFTAGLLQVTWGRAVSQDRWPWGFHNELLPSHTLPPVRQVSQLLRVEASWGPRDHRGGGHPGVVVHTFNLRAQARGWVNL